MRVEREPMRLVHPLREPGERSVGDVDHCVAAMADEVRVTEGPKVVEGRTVARVHVLDDAEITEALQHAVHRRRGDAPLSPRDRRDQIVSGEVRVGLDEH